jgi:hypothetical protein
MSRARRSIVLPVALSNQMDHDDASVVSGSDAEAIKNCALRSACIVPA